MKKVQILIAMLALSFSLHSQSDRVHTVQVPDSASMIIFDTAGTQILGTDVQEAIEESNPIYTNHVFLSQDGDNATGVLGDPHRAFRDPWASKDSLQAYNSLSFEMYDGRYNYSGPYTAGLPSNLALYADSLHFNGLGFADFNLTGINNTTYSGILIDDRVSGQARAKYIDIQAPSTNFLFEKTGGVESIPITLLSTLSVLKINANNLISKGSASYGMATSTKAEIKLDSVYIQGGAAIIMNNAVTPGGLTAASVVSRNIKARINTHETPLQTLFTSGAITMFPSTTRDSASLIDIEIGRMKITGRGGPVVITTPSGSERNRIAVKIKNLEAVGCSQPRNGYNTGISNIGAAQIFPLNNGSHTLIEGGDWNVSTGPLFATFAGSNIVLDSAVLHYKLGKVMVDTGSFMIINRLTLRNNSHVIIECDYCETKGGAFAWVFGNTIDATSSIEFRGTFKTRLAGSAVINTRNNITLEGVFINDGVSAWIDSDTPTPIIMSNGVWSNSDVYTDVTIVGTSLWGFRNPGPGAFPQNLSYTHLQEIIDSTAAKAVGTTTFAGSGALTLGLSDIHITGLSPALSEKFIHTDSNMTYLGDTAFLKIDYAGTVELDPALLGTYVVEFTPYQNATALQHGGSDIAIVVDDAELWLLPFGNSIIVQAIPGDVFSIRYRGTVGAPATLRNLSFTAHRL